MALVEEREQLEGGNVAIALPGVRRGDLSARNQKPEINVFAVRFSPTGQSWAAATTEGLLMYSLNKGIVFDPYQLSVEITPKATRELLRKRDFSAALIMALKLNETSLIQEVVEGVPYRDGEEFELHNIGFKILTFKLVSLSWTDRPIDAGWVCPPHAAVCVQDRRHECAHRVLPEVGEPAVDAAWPAGKRADAANAGAAAPNAEPEVRVVEQDVSSNVFSLL